MRLILLSCVIVLIAACASGGGGRNPTIYEAQFDERVMDREKFSKFVIATVNLGKPSRTYLQEHEAKVDDMVQEYLEKQGYEFVDPKLFDEAYQEGVRKFGEPFDETTGRMNERSFVAALQEAARILTETSEVDAIVFTNLEESQVFFSSGINHIARFHGVARKPSMQGPGQGVSTDFNWAAEVDAVSLFVNIFDLELKRLFHSAGGIELTEAIDTKGSRARFARRRTVLGNSGQIKEGIQLAFHPFITMKNWPGE